MEKPIEFNPKPSTILHLDLNSCFARIEQQANPFLRGKPVAVAAYTGPSGCIIAPSVEAKELGVKVGMRVKDGKLLCPQLMILSPDPNKYRAVHLKLRRLLETYTSDITPKSIDEFVLDLENVPLFHKIGIWEIAKQIKLRLKSEIGEWLTISVGIAPNRFLAKTAASLQKPDGLNEININNFENIYSRLKLTDLCGIKVNNAIRLNNFNIFTVLNFYRASIDTLKSAFHSVVGYDWYLRLHGFEVDDIVSSRKSFGNSYALPKPLILPGELAPILQKLVEKMSFRMRKANFKARGINVSIIYRNWSSWHKGETVNELLFDSRDIYKLAFKIMCHSSYSFPVRILAVSCFDLVASQNIQLALLSDLDKKNRLVQAIDKVNERWGDFVLTPALMLGTKDLVPDRISFTQSPLSFLGQNSSIPQKLQ